MVEVSVADARRLNKNVRASARRRERRENDPEYRARVQAQYRECYHNTIKNKPGRREAKREYHRERRADPSKRGMLAENQRRYREKYRITRLVAGARNRAKSRGLPFDYEYMTTVVSKLRPEFCPCCGAILDYSYQGNNKFPLPNGPSLDQIIPAGGYMEGNVEIICWRCNSIKRDATLVELESIVLYLRSKS